MGRGRAEVDRTIDKKVKGRVLDVMEEMGTRQEILTEMNGWIWIARSSRTMWSKKGIPN
jgi:hypothetical protein